MVIKEQRYKSYCMVLKNTSNCKMIINAVHTGTWFRFIETIQTYAKADFDNRFDGMFPKRKLNGDAKQRQILAAKSRTFHNVIKSVLPLLRQDAKIYEGEKQVHYELAKAFIENYDMRGVTMIFREKIAKFHDDGPDAWH